MKKSIFAAAMGLTLFAFGATSASAAVLNVKKGIVGKVCFFSKALAYDDGVLMQLRCRGAGQGGSLCVGQAIRADGGHPERVLQFTGSAWADQSVCQGNVSGTNGCGSVSNGYNDSGASRILINLDGTMRKADTDEFGFAGAGLTIMQQIAGTINPVNGQGSWEGIDTIGIMSTTDSGARTDGLPDIDPKTCPDPATCNGQIGQFINAGTIEYLGKGDCPSTPYTHPGL